MTANTMREAFEKWAVSEGMPITRGHYYDVYASAETRAAYLAWQAAQSVPVVGEPDCYDAGLLNDFGGGNVGWWQDYIRAELARAHEFYAGQWPTTSITAAELERLRSIVAEVAGGILHDMPLRVCSCAQCELIRKAKAAIAQERQP